MSRQTSIDLVEFDQHGDIDRIDRKNSQNFRHVFHQLGLILIVCLYVLIGGIFFSTIESRHFSLQEQQRRAIFREIYQNMRQLTDELFNDQLNEDFQDAFSRWRWNCSNQSNWIELNENRTFRFDKQIDKEVKNLLERLADRQFISERYAYKWSYSTAILYAATLVTTIGYGNIAPKTVLGKISTVICK